MASSPLSLTMAIAPSPIGVDIAAIVSKSMRFTPLLSKLIYNGMFY
jgi:hypothetical protein